MFSERYPEMGRLLRVYFGQDFDLFGETVPEIVACYQDDNPHLCSALAGEGEPFMTAHRTDLDAAFEKNCGRDFHPARWGYTTASFFNELKRLLLD